MLHKTPLLLLIIIALILIFDGVMPLPVKTFLFSMSLTIKTFIVFLLPFIIFSLLFNVAVKLAKQASAVLLLLLLAICCSNFISTWLSHYIGMIVYGWDHTLNIPRQMNSLTPYWDFSLPKILDNDKAMFVGIFLGLILPMLSQKKAYALARFFEILVKQILTILTYIIPIFVTGFICKLQADGVMLAIFRDYSVIFAIIALAQVSYISFLYLFANGFQMINFRRSLKNMLPAAITGFSTMSSAAAMPLTIMASEKNARNRDLARSLVPATVNVHLIGDCFAIPIFAFAILKSYGLEMPSEFSYLMFASYFIVAKFSVAAIPGGGILVMLPILEKYLGFNGDMLSLITALYILFDPVITCANVLGNGAFVMIMDGLTEKFRYKKSLSKV